MIRVARRRGAAAPRETDQSGLFFEFGRDSRTPLYVRVIGIDVLLVELEALVVRDGAGVAEVVDAAQLALA